MRIVMKIGGALDGRGNEALRATLGQAREGGHEVILVHGGGPEISRQLAEAGIDLPFVDGLRVTTEAAMPVVLRALQHCNAQLYHQLDPTGDVIVPFTDGTTVQAQFCGRDRVGEVNDVVTQPLVEQLQKHRVPLLPPYGVDATGQFYNLNADTTAAHVAKAVNADKLLLCTNVAGVFADFSLGVQLYDVTREDLERHLAESAFSAGMIPKVNAMLFAASRGVKEVWVVDGGDPDSLSFALLHEAAPFDPARTSHGTRLTTRTRVAGASRVAK
ncbi:acetylglutamate kinase [Alicyclobacillus fastidiosus]|uniref:acetylglutamate kinase n=1 Tax=Alicyclobacillus fastidiosus TaxID=392011 RepID=A0ABY6ZCA3_9BACL|nr:acetylglutamate kinase [Alicyclobacillus fastidiosus]WAH40472.1 acetylglutamate kinase [Alicyclobacillus fastidiosus]